MNKRWIRLGAAVLAIVLAGVIGLSQAQAPFRSGAFVQSNDGSQWVIVGGEKRPIVWQSDPDDALAIIPEGDPVSSILEAIQQPVTVAPAAPAQPAPSARPVAPPAPVPLADAVALTDRGLAVTERYALGMAAYENRTSSPVSTEFEFRYFDAAGTLIRRNTSALTHVWPGQTGVVIDETTRTDGTPARIEVRVTSSAPRVRPEGVSIETIDPGLTGTASSPRARFIIANNGDRDIEDIRVSIALYDANGTFVGGGYTYADLVPARARASFTASVSFTGTPTRVRVSPGWVNITELQ